MRVFGVRGHGIFHLQAFSRLGVGTERVGGTECVGGVVFQEEPVVSRHQQNSGFTEFSSGYVQENVRDLQLEPPAGTTARNLHLEPSARTIGWNLQLEPSALT